MINYPDDNERFGDKVISFCKILSLIRLVLGKSPKPILQRTANNSRITPLQWHQLTIMDLHVGLTLMLDEKISCYLVSSDVKSEKV